MKRIVFIFRENELFSTFMPPLIKSLEQKYTVLVKRFPADEAVDINEIESFLENCVPEDVIFADMTSCSITYKLRDCKRLDAMFSEIITKYIGFPKKEEDFEEALRFLVPHLEKDNFKEIYLVKQNLFDHCTLLPSGSKLQDWTEKKDELSIIMQEKMETIFKKIFPNANVEIGEIEKGVTGRKKDVLVVIDRHHEAASYITRGPVPPEFESGFLILPITSHISWLEKLGKVIVSKKILTNKNVAEAFFSFLQ